MLQVQNSIIYLAEDIDEDLFADGELYNDLVASSSDAASQNSTLSNDYQIALLFILGVIAGVMIFGSRR